MIWLGLACLIASLPAWVVLSFRALRNLERLVRDLDIELLNRSS